MDLDAVRTFVAVAESGRFQHAAGTLALTQQAVSKGIAALESDVGVRLFTRTPRGAELTLDGQALLPHARELLRVEQRAAASVRPGQRALRVDVIGRRLATAGLLRDFHRAHPETELDVVALLERDAAIAAIGDGTIDASFRAVDAGRLPGDVAAARVLDEPLELLVGPGHALAGERRVALASLAEHRIWMPGILPGSEWADYYAQLEAAFGLTIDAIGPNFGLEALLDTIADTPALATFTGSLTRVLWPSDAGLRRIAIVDPTPVYPHSLLWRADDAHPALATLRAFLGTPAPNAGAWAPSWA